MNLAISLGGTATLGPPGPLLGTVVSSALVSWWWILLFLRRHFRLSRAELLGAALRPVVVAVPYGLGLALLAEAIPAYGPGWPGWAKWAALAGWLGGAAVGSLALGWAFGLPADDRREWAGRLRRRA